MNSEFQKQLLTEYDFGNIRSVRLFGNGHINATYLLSTEKGEFILQKINRYVFREPEKLMENMAKVLDYINEREPGLRLIPTADGKKYVRDREGEIWRLTGYLPAKPMDKVTELGDIITAGTGFSHFQYLLRDFPAGILHETIPHFHDTRFRYDGFLSVVSEDPCRRKSGVTEEIEWVLSWKKLADFEMDAYENGKIPLRVTHNDTKLNNLLIDEASGKVKAVIDLDTVMPGFLMNDFGDGIRTAVNTAAEDETDLSRVSCDLSFFEGFTKGFCSEITDLLSETEAAFLAYGPLIMTYENALRFLEDYLKGNVYFKVSHDSHNLERMRNQRTLFQDMLKKWDSIKMICEKYTGVPADDTLFD